MKKIIVLLIAVLALSSCFNVQICSGSVKEETPLVETHRIVNNHFLFGLIPSGKSTIDVETYLNEHKDYQVKTNQTFVNGLLSAITFGIYTPTTTTFYLPVDAKK